MKSASARPQSARARSSPRISCSSVERRCASSGSCLERPQRFVGAIEHEQGVDARDPGLAREHAARKAGEVVVQRRERRRRIVLAAQQAHRLFERQNLLRGGRRFGALDRRRRQRRLASRRRPASGSAGRSRSSPPARARRSGAAGLGSARSAAATSGAGMSGRGRRSRRAACRMVARFFACSTGSGAAGRYRSEPKPLAQRSKPARLVSQHRRHAHGQQRGHDRRPQPEGRPRAALRLQTLLDDPTAVDRRDRRGMRSGARASRASAAARSSSDVPPSGRSRQRRNRVDVRWMLLHGRSFLFLQLAHPLDEGAPRAGESHPDRAQPRPRDLGDALARETFQLEQNEGRAVRLAEPVQDPIARAAARSRTSSWATGSCAPSPASDGGACGRPRLGLGPARSPTTTTAGAAASPGRRAR